MKGMQPGTPDMHNLLRAYLPAEMLADFIHGAVPAPDLVAAACIRLRADLEGIASYIPGVIVRRQLANPQPGHVSGSYWHGTILFADLSGFTAMSAQLSTLGKQGAEEVSTLINGLFAGLVAETQRYDGELLKFGGDALTAFFDEQKLGPDHAAHAASAALAMQQRMQQFDTIQTRAGMFKLRLRIGVHSGQVFAAEVGDQSHIELVVTGRNINRVAEAQEIAEPGQVVISRETMWLIPRLAAPERHAGFHLLQQLPAIAPSARLHMGYWQAGQADMDELLALAQRYLALRPYLPHGLPRRFMETNNQEETGEFRPVTVLFANFTSFSHALTILGDDAVTAANILNAYYSRAQASIHRYGGIVNKVDMYTRGDKLMALFGAPLAHENDPERAVRCALDLKQVLEEANREITPLLARAAGKLVQIENSFLQQKIGLNTGVVFAGMVGSALRHEYTVMGQTVNLAARLMSVASAASVVLSPSTRRAVEAQIAIRELAPVQLKGVPEPVALVEALYPRISDAGRIGLRQADLVGRAGELELMTQVARRALTGSGRIIAVVGETGIGKSRLVGELIGRLLEPGTGTLGFFPVIAECQSYDQNSAYATTRQFLSVLLGMESNTTAQRLGRRIDNLAPELARFMPLLSDILGIDIPETALTRSLSPEQRHDRALDLIEALVIATARSQPLVLVIDDLHWSDASSIELLERLARAAGRAPLLLVLGYRNEAGFAEPWTSLEVCTRVELGELNSASSAALVRSLLSGANLAGLDLLLEKTQGNPFFIEAVVQTLIESGTLVQSSSGWQAARPLDQASIPDSVEGVIIARLDRLAEPLRETIQVAAVIGRRFGYSIINGVASQREQLSRRLEQLCTSAIMVQEPDQYETSFHFTHALTRDVAYETILFVRRRDLHRRVAQRIEALYQDTLDEHSPLLARHYLLAEEWQPAFDYHLRAGRQAQERFANREAIALLERAIVIAQTLASAGKPVPQSQQAELYERLGALHTLIGELDQAEARYQEALGVFEHTQDVPPDLIAQLYYGLARVDEKRAQFERAFERIEQALQIGNERISPTRVQCLLLGAGLLRRFGRYQQSLEWGERALQMAAATNSQRDQALALKLQGGTYRNIGEMQRAMELTEQALELFRGIQDLDGLAYAFNDLANIYTDLGRLDEARSNYESGVTLKQTIGDVYGQALIASNLGEVYRLEGSIDAAIAQYGQALAIFEQMNSAYMTGVLHMNLAAAHLLRGDLVSADAHLRPSADLLKRAGAEDFLPELERYEAELELRRGNLTSARQRAEQALATALRLEARLEEGITRRLLAEIKDAANERQAAWEELTRSLTALRDGGSPHEIARTQTARAGIGYQIGQEAEGRLALQEALHLFQEAGARRDLAAAQALLAHYPPTHS